MSQLSTLQDWQSAYAQGQFKLDDLYDYVGSISNDDYAWIEIASQQQLEVQIELLLNQDPAQFPLYGIPFAVKDNIDV